MSRWQPGAEGRLAAAAMGLFTDQGYDETTVADIALAAGLTKRTFFRYFADKREVLFSGSAEFEEVWIVGIDSAPAGASPLTALSAGLDAVAAFFVARHAFAGTRARIIAAHPDLRERELIKLQKLAGAITLALMHRGISENAAILAAQSGVTVFHVAFARWVEQADPAALRPLMHQTLDELRALALT